jgi:hypothetical protein
MDRRAGTRTPRAWMKRALTAGTERKQESTVVGVHTDKELDVLRNLMHRLGLTAKSQLENHEQGQENGTELDVFHR